MESEKYSLSWREFDKSTTNYFKNLLNDTYFTDVTLACEDDKRNCLVSYYLSVLCYLDGFNCCSI